MKVRQKAPRRVGNRSSAASSRESKSCSASRAVTSAVSVVLPWASSPCLGGLTAVLFNQTLVEVCRVGEVTVVRQAERAVRGGTEGGLCVSPVGCAGGGVSGVADGVVAGHGAEGGFVKDLGDESHILYTWMRLPLLVAIPADSWPRCWSAYRP